MPARYLTKTNFEHRTSFLSDWKLHSPCFVVRWPGSLALEPLADPQTELVSRRSDISSTTNPRMVPSSAWQGRLSPGFNSFSSSPSYTPSSTSTSAPGCSSGLRSLERTMLTLTSIHPCPSLLIASSQIPWLASIQVKLNILRINRSKYFPSRLSWNIFYPD